MSNKKDSIYIYLWEEFNTIYVGRTINPKSRHYQHRHIPTESTYQFSCEHGVEHPKMIIIENDLTVEEGIEREKYWIKEYRENSHYNVLNKTKGGEIGTSDGVKWTKETVLEEAKKYDSLSQFKYNNNSAYSSARLNDWLKEMTWFKRPIYITKWSKKAVFEEAKKYSKKYHFKKGCESAYNVAKKNKWLDEIFGSGNLYSMKWTKDAVFEEAKKYSTRDKFHRGNPSAYQVARKNKWLCEMTWLKPGVKWTKDTVFEEAKKFPTAIIFKKESSVAYRVAFKNKWLNEMNWLGYKPKKKI